MKAKASRNFPIAMLIMMACMALYACGGGGGGGGGPFETAPAITNLTYYPSSAQLNDGGGTILVTGTVDFSDPDGDVSSFTIVTYNTAGQQLSSTTNPVQGVNGHTSGTVVVSVLAPTTVAGDYTFQVFLIDASNRTSNRLSGTFSVMADGGGQGILVTPTGPSPSHLVEHKGELFWSEAGEESINKVSLAGGSAEVLALRVEAPEEVAVQGQDVFWLESRSGFSPSGCAGPGVIRNLHKTSLDGGTSVLLATGDSCGDVTTDLVADDTSVYWATSTASPNTYVIHKIPVSGGTSTTIATTSVPIVAMTGDDTNLYWMENQFPDTANIRSVPKAGGTPATIAGGFVSRAVTFAINGTSVFFTQANFPSTDNLVKAPLTGGAPALLSTLSGTPRKMVADDTNVYWVDGAGVSAVPVDGQSPTVLADAVNSPLDLAMSSDTLIWTDTTGPAHGETGALRAVPKAGGQITVLFQGGDAPRQLSVDGSWIYWTEGGPIGLGEGFGRIARVPAAGGVEQTIVSGVSSDSPPIAVSDTHVFIADKFRIKKVPLVGGVAETVAAGSFYISDLSTDGMYVYWAEDPLAVVFKAPVEGGDPTFLAAVPAGVNAGPAGPVRLQDGIVYWMTHYDAIISVPAAGGTPQVVASGLPFLNDFVVDSGHVYFSENDTGKIRKVSLIGNQFSELVQESSLWSPNILTTDGLSLYWINQEHVGKVPVAGGPYSIIVSSVSSDPFVPGSIAVDTTSVYWTEPPVMEIRKALK